MLEKPFPEGLVPRGAIHLRSGFDNPWGSLLTQYSVLL